MSNGLVKCNRKPTGRIIIAEQHIGDGCAGGLPWIPRFNDGGYLPVRPIYRNCTPVQEDQDDRYAKLVDSLDQLLLDSGQFQVKPITTFETFHFHLHFFPLQPRRKPHHHNHCIRFFGRLHCFFHEIRTGRRPEQPHMGIALHFVELNHDFI
ncbi:hypothetical protein ES703_20438 [subsurface metagenome]